MWVKRGKVDVMWKSIKDLTNCIELLNNRIEVERLNMDILNMRITNGFDLIRAEIEEHEARFHAKKGKK